VFVLGSAVCVVIYPEIESVASMDITILKHCWYLILFICRCCNVCICIANCVCISWSDCMCCLF